MLAEVAYEGNGYYGACYTVRVAGTYQLDIALQQGAGLVSLKTEELAFSPAAVDAQSCVVVDHSHPGDEPMCQSGEKIKVGSSPPLFGRAVHREARFCLGICPGTDLTSEALDLQPTSSGPQPMSVGPQLTSVGPPLVSVLGRIGNACCNSFSLFQGHKGGWHCFGSLSAVFGLLGPISAPRRPI